ncbi:hypothetical protein [Marinobacter sp. MIT932201]
MEVQFIKTVLNLLAFYLQNISKSDLEKAMGVVMDVLIGISRLE